METDLNAADRKAINELQGIIVDAWETWSKNRTDGRKGGIPLLAMVAVAAYNKGLQDGQKNQQGR